MVESILLAAGANPVDLSSTDFTGRGGYGSQPWADGPIGWMHPGEDILTSAPNPATECMVDGDGILNDASISAQLIITGVDITPVASIAVNRHRLNRDKFNAFGEPQDLLPAIPLYKDYAYGARRARRSPVRRPAGLGTHLCRRR